MEVHIRMGDRVDGKGQIFLVADAKDPVGIPAGELLLVQGMGHLRLSCPQNLLGKSGYAVPQLLAFVVKFGNGRLLVGSFVNELAEEVLRGKFKIWSPEKNVSDTRANATKDAPTVPDKTVNNTKISDSPNTKVKYFDTPDFLNPAEKSSDLPESILETPTPEASVDAPEDAAPPDTSAADPTPEDAAPVITYKHIEITDIRQLPKRNWYLCNNSFLVHGFFNYHYLVLKTVEQGGQVQRFLGVPGIYEQPERMMALMFGFPEFEAAQTEDAGGANSLFGYWVCPLAGD
jgi:hypothetical protein